MAHRRDPRAQAEPNDDITDALRRRLVKGGAVAIPVIVSLQSGTAWALSSCASRLARPSTGNMTSTFGPSPGSPSSTQQANRDFVETVTGVSQTDITTALSNFTAAAGNHPETGGVQASEIMHLVVTNGSCWSSNCVGTINGLGDVTITNDTTPSSCV